MTLPPEYLPAFTAALEALQRELIMYGPDHRIITRGQPATPMNQERAARYAAITAHLDKLKELIP